MSEIQGRILMNGKVMDYLIHGQKCKLSVDLNHCKYLLFYSRIPFMGSYHKARFFKPGKIGFWNFYKFFSNIQIGNNPSEIEFVANAYYPIIHFYVFKHYWSLKPKKIIINLNINFVNAQPMDVQTENNSMQLKNNTQIEILQQTIRTKKSILKIEIENPTILNLPINLNYKNFEI